VKLSVEVNGVPPKKDGASSMWKKPTEVQRIRQLRLAVATALAGRTAPQGSCRLDLEVQAGRADGDLDNFITGICDGLQPVHPNTPIAPDDWEGLPAEALPHYPLALSNDALVDEIRAKRIPPRPGDGLGYRLTIEWLDS